MEKINNNIVYLHGLFTNDELELIVQKKDECIKDKVSYNMMADRYFFNSIDIAKMIFEKIKTCHESSCVLPNMRIIYYNNGGYIAPHYDGYQIDPNNSKESTHTFLLYLNDCEKGEGDTEFLESLTDTTVVASITPKKGSILIFPHKTAHQGQCVGKEKILLRGDFY